MRKDPRTAAAGAASNEIVQEKGNSRHDLVLVLVLVLDLIFHLIFRLLECA